jgi:L-alanine-DL-glutamate epimerase-like enolase superfamily enzyme
MRPARTDRPIDRVDVSVFTVPTERPESDGTFAWDATTMVLVELSAAGRQGLGYTYADRAAASLIAGRFARLLEGRDAFAIPVLWSALCADLRNTGRPGLGMMAVAAVDVALWDLKARLLGVPLWSLLGPARAAVPIYGSGGFTSYDLPTLIGQLAGWVDQGIPRVKMKVGRDPAQDRGRVRAVRQALGDAPALFVDANGAYTRKEALAFARAFADDGVSWFEEPVSSDDLQGLRWLRDRGPPGMQIAAGEYGFEPRDFADMITAGAVDVLQADATRCGGITGFLRVAALCDALGVPLSAHTAPALHLPACVAAPRLAHLEYFHDHVRVEALLFDGAQTPTAGMLAPDPERPGLGLTLKRADARRFAET